jgi:chorismate synthase
MAFEQDLVRITAGVRWGETIGSPLAIEIANSEWPKWQQVMSADAIDQASLDDQARATPLRRPRPGHADLAGMQKYDFDEARPILERASARETAARVAAGEVARLLLRQGLGIEILSQVVSIGSVQAPNGQVLRVEDRSRIDADPVRCLDPASSANMQALIEQTAQVGDTLGGVVELWIWGAPPGLGSHAVAEERLDARLAGAMMSIQAVKGVEIGDGFDLAAELGSAVHDPMTFDDGRIVRTTDRAGGIEGGMSNGEIIRLRIAMKPIATLTRALGTVNLSSRRGDLADHQRSDVCAVPALGVIAEAQAALVLAGACLAKFGGDTVADLAASVEHYHQRLIDQGLAGRW